MALLSEEIAKLKYQNAYRSRQALESPQGIKIIVSGKQYISFCSNDYLGLANDTRVCDAAKKAIDLYGVGSGASQLITGYSTAHAELEKQLALFFNYPRCILFSSGYLANMGVVSSLVKKNSTIVADKLNHASLIDAAIYASVKLKRYKHLDYEHARNILIKENSTHCLLVTDGVFSMQGSIAPLNELANIKHSATLIVDDAHGIGVLGNQGKGTLENHHMSSKHVDILIGTFGKSFGVSGAFVLGSENMIDYITQKARTLIYTTAPPPALAMAASKSLEIIINEPERRHRLHDNIQYFKQCAQHTSLNLLDSNTAIQCLIIGDNDKALAYSEKLKQKGLLILAIRPPTVPKDTARLRITLTSEHTHAHIEQLMSELINLQ